MHISIMVGHPTVIHSKTFALILAAANHSLNLYSPLYPNLKRVNWKEIMQNIIHVFDNFTSHIQIEETVSKVILAWLLGTTIISRKNYVRVQVNLYNRNFFSKNVKSIHIQIYNRTMDRAVIFISKKMEEMTLRMLVNKKLLTMLKSKEAIMHLKLPQTVKEDLVKEMENCWCENVIKLKKECFKEKQTRSLDLIYAQRARCFDNDDRFQIP